MFKFKKVASLLASAAMLTSTVALAAAASYPGPFLQSGSAADTAVVYGASSTLDLAAVQNVLDDLNRKVTAKVTGGNVTVTGESVKIEKSSTKFQLGKGSSDVVATAITSSSPGNGLPTLLADGIYTDSSNDEFDFTQKVTLANLTLNMWEDNDYQKDTPVTAIKIANGQSVLNYTLEFVDYPTWATLATTNIKLMGKEYYVLSDTVNTTMNLLDSASSATLKEGETTTLTVDGKPYTVAVGFVSSTSKVKLIINGETTNSLAAADTQRLSDGAYVGIKSVDYTAKESGVSQVEFSIGKGKLKLVSGSEVELNDDPISNLYAYFTNGAEKVQKVIIQWRADDDLFVTPDNTISMPGFGVVDVAFTGMTFPTEEKIEVAHSSDTYVSLKNFPLKDSTETISIIYANTTGYFGVGKDSDELLRTSNSSTLAYDSDTDAYFIASWTDGKDAESYLMRSTSFKTENNINKTTIQYKKDGVWADAKADAKADDVVNVGNAEFTVKLVEKDAKKLNVTASTGTDFHTLYSKEGLKVYLPYNATSVVDASAGALNSSVDNPTTFALVFSEEDENDNIGGGKNLTVTLGLDTNKEVSVTDIVGESATFVELLDSRVWESYVYSPLATKISWDKSGDQYMTTLTYHGSESYGNLYVTSPGSVSTDSGGSFNALSVNDGEAAQMAGKNLIVVGGSCVNKIAAQLLGLTFPACGDAWQTRTGVASGNWLIQTFDNGGKVATLVAGYNAPDTTNAATAFTTQSTIDLTAGKKYTGTTATSATLVTTQI